MVHCGFFCPFSQYIANTGATKSQKGCMHTSQVPAISDGLCSHCKCVEVVCSSNLSRLERSRICSDHLEGLIKLEGLEEESG